MPGARTLLLSTSDPSIRMLLSPMTTMSSIVADLSKQPCPMVTYFPMMVAAESPVGDVLQQRRTAISYIAETHISALLLPITP